MQKSNPNEVSSGSESVSLEQVSNLFSLPLSDAAEFLGLSTTALKTICYQNGLLRWPHRKFLAGKTIDQIKMDAIAPKTNLPISSVQEMSKSINLEHPQSQGSNTLVPGNMLTRANPDEFKYGFPSDGLSTISFRWWENNNCPEGSQLSSFTDKKDSENPNRTGCFGGNDSKNEIQARINNSGSLSDLRNKAVNEGKAALRLGVYKGHGIGKLDRNKRSALTQIFKSSLPSQWEHGLS